MNKKILIWISIVILIVVTISVAIWFVFANQPKASNSKNQTVFSSTSQDAAVSASGFDRKVFIPKSFKADFTNLYDLPSGAGHLENDFIRIAITPDTTTLDKNNNPIRIKDIIFDKSKELNATEGYDLVDEKRQIYRKRADARDGQIFYYQREQDDNFMYHYRFIITEKHENSARGIYMSVLFINDSISQEEKSNQLLQADQVLLSQFP